MVADVGAESISNRLNAARASVLAARGLEIAEALNAAIRQFLPTSFAIGSQGIVDHEGARIPAPSCVIHRASTASASESENLSADIVVVVIDVQEAMELESFCAAYKRVSAAKALKMTPLAADSSDPGVIMGIIFALRATGPMESFASELEALNAATPSEQWPDAVVFAETGVISYAVQFPGEKVFGNWLIAKSAYASKTTPPFYIPIVICPTGVRAFDKTLVLISGRISASTSSAVPEWNAMQAEVPENVIIWSGYQYNLEGEMKPVPHDQYEDSSIPPPVSYIQDKEGAVLAAVQLLPWQDGSVVLSTGKFPVDMLFAYMDRPFIARASVFRRNGRQISSVLPITQADFNAALGRFQAGSNMVVRPDSTRLIIQRVQDEGTSSPFIARIFLGLLYLRNLALNDKAGREKFDNLHEAMTSHLFNARDAVREIEETWGSHREKVASGECVRTDGRAIHITGNIDRELRKEADSYLNASVRALKEGVQRVAQHLGLDIGFLFMKHATFEARVSALERSNQELATYLRQTRQWSEPLIQRRIALEHGGWTLPKVTYTPNGASVDLGEPVIAGQPITEFATSTFDRVAVFADEITAYGIQRNLPANMGLTEIPVSKRTSEAPKRFLITSTEGGLPLWRLAFRSDRFENI